MTTYAALEEHRLVVSEATVGAGDVAAVMAAVQAARTGAYA